MNLWMYTALTVLLLTTFSLSIIAIPTSAAFETRPTYLVENMPNEARLPRNFRTTQSPFQPSAKTPSIKGLDQLNISGSAQFSEDSLKTLLSKLNNPSKLMIVDLREESHGFANGMAISWFSPKNWINAGKTPKQVEEDENKRLAELLKEKEIVVYTILKKNIDDTIQEKSKQSLVVSSVSNEGQLAKKVRADYLRICVREHVRPSDKEVEQFVSFVDNLSSDTWVHFHCLAGKGRTTTFMAMFDMMRNAKEVSLKDILDRQHLLGGSDLAQDEDINSWKYPYAIERLQFLKRFYEFSKTRSQETNKSWMNAVAKMPSEHS